MSRVQKRHYGISLLLCAVLVVLPLVARAEEPSGQNKNDWFSKNIRVLLFGTSQEPSTSSQNPDNAFLRIPRYSTELDLRPDFAIDTPKVNWTFKPRVTSVTSWWRDGEPAGERDREARFYVNEWMVQPKLTDELFVSFGKQKMLWGASFFVSPSNILFRDTEKVNPKAEVEGKYMSSVVYMPNRTVTITGIGETQREESAFGEPLRPIRALKVDIMGGSSQISVIGYSQQHERFRLGSYGQWTASDAVLLYYDGIVSRGTDVLYPLPDPANPLGGTFTARYDGSDRLVTTTVIGGAYTFLSGSTFNLEFLYNGQGYNDADAAEYYRIRGQAGNHYFDGGMLSALSAQTLGQTANLGMPFLRRYYLMGQYQMREISDVLDIILRYAHGLEERAGQASTILEWKLSDRVQFFNINMVSVDHGKESEFNALLGWSVMAGIEVHF